MNEIKPEKTNNTTKTNVEVKQEANAEVKQETKVEKHEDNAPSWSEFREFKKQIKALSEEKHKNSVKEVYLKNGGKPEYFDDFYAGNRFDKVEDLSKAMEEVKSKKTIYFNKINFSGIENFTKENGIEVKQEEVLTDSSQMKNILDRK